MALKIKFLLITICKDFYYIIKIIKTSRKNLFYLAQNKLKKILMKKSLLKLKHKILKLKLKN
jgi:hypothetical protein